MFDLLTRLFYIIFLPRLSYLRSVSFCLSRCLTYTHTHRHTIDTHFSYEKSRSNVLLLHTGYSWYCTSKLHSLSYILFSSIRPSPPQDVPVISSVDSWTSFPTVIALFLTTSPTTVTRIYRSAARTALPVPWSRSSSSRKRGMTRKMLEKNLPACHRNDNDHLLNNGPRSEVDVSHDK